MRDANVPVGHLKNGAGGIARAAGAVHFYAMYEGPQAAFVDPDGRVIAAPIGSNLQVRLFDAHLDWCIGTYASDVRSKRNIELSRARLEEDLRDRARELREVVEA